MTNSKIISICVVGGAGRMGRRVIELCNELESVNVASVLVRPDDKAEGIGMVRVETEPRLAFEGIDVIIDFSAPPSIDSTLKAAVDLGVPYVLASTGLSEKDEETLSEAAKSIPLIVASNCS